MGRLLKHPPILFSVESDGQVVAFDKLLVLATPFAVCLSVLGSLLFANDLDLGVCGGKPNSFTATCLRVW